MKSITNWLARCSRSHIGSFEMGNAARFKILRRSGLILQDTVGVGGTGTAPDAILFQGVVRKSGKSFRSDATLYDSIAL